MRLDLGATQLQCADRLKIGQRPRDTQIDGSLTLGTTEHRAEKVLKQFQPNQSAYPQIRGDRAQQPRKANRVEDLNGSTGTWRLRRELLNRFNTVMDPKKVDAVLIESMLIQ